MFNASRLHRDSFPEPPPPNYQVLEMRTFFCLVAGGAKGGTEGAVEVGGEPGQG